MINSYQSTFWDISDEECPLSPAVLQAVSAMAAGEVKNERGAVFTRTEIVDFILDISGYTANLALAGKNILEPSFGGGDFLFPIIERLISSWKNSGGKIAGCFYELRDSIRAVELHNATFQVTRERVIERLHSLEIAEKTAKRLTDSWLIQGDFLLQTFKEKFDFILGNPPYVRQELIPNVLMAEYRKRFSTIYDRADQYIPFIEHSLRLLKQGGIFGVICSDRWMKNRYGGPLRNLVADSFNLKIHVDMKGTNAFQDEVSVYPAITVISREKQGKTKIARQPDIEKNELKRLAGFLSDQSRKINGFHVQESSGICNGGSPWLFDSANQIDLLRRLEAEFPSIEEAGCKVGIGVATGADKVFIGSFENIDIEPDRPLPLVRTKDITSGEICWGGLRVINPFTEDGRLVDLKRYPKLSRYFHLNQTTLKKRHCAQKSPDSWYRTIDRIWPDLLTRPKLLIPDIKNEPNIVYDCGEYYPHHNLYYVISNEWDLKALQAVLLSDVSKLLVSIYTTKIRGGYLRFQAQYIRRIRIPNWPDVSEKLRQELIQAAESRNIDACNQAAFKLYGFSSEERAVIQMSNKKTNQSRARQEAEPHQKPLPYGRDSDYNQSLLSGTQ